MSETVLTDQEQPYVLPSASQQYYDPAVELTSRNLLASYFGTPDQPGLISQQIPIPIQQSLGFLRLRYRLGMQLKDLVVLVASLLKRKECIVSLDKHSIPERLGFMEILKLELCICKALALMIQPWGNSFLTLKVDQ